MWGISTYRIAEAGEDESDEEGEASAAPRDPLADPNDEFNFEKYDEEDNSKYLKLKCGIFISARAAGTIQTRYNEPGHTGFLVSRCLTLSSTHV